MVVFLKLLPNKLYPVVKLIFGEFPSPTLYLGVPMTDWTESLIDPWNVVIADVIIL